jgi:hypothetical protein
MYSFCISHALLISFAFSPLVLIPLFIVLSLANTGFACHIG